MARAQKQIGFRNRGVTQDQWTKFKEDFATAASSRLSPKEGTDTILSYQPTSSDFLFTLGIAYGREVKQTISLGLSHIRVPGLTPELFGILEVAFPGVIKRDTDEENALHSCLPRMLSDPIAIVDRVFEIASQLARVPSLVPVSTSGNIVLLEAIRQFRNEINFAKGKNADINLLDPGLVPALSGSESKLEHAVFLAINTLKQDSDLAKVMRCLRSFTY